jgi:hypothetical protein
MYRCIPCSETSRFTACTAYNPTDVSCPTASHLSSFIFTFLTFFRFNSGLCLISRSQTGQSVGLEVGQLLDKHLIVRMDETCDDLESTVDLRISIDMYIDLRPTSRMVFRRAAIA